MPRRPDPDVPAMRVSSAATASADHAHGRPPSTNCLRDLLALSRLPCGPSHWPRGRPSMRSG
eukprot:4715969-Prymnesium_polylepis.1